MKSRVTITQSRVGAYTPTPFGEPLTHAPSYLDKVLHKYTEGRAQTYTEPLTHVHLPTPWYLR
jgi:hypothetical protein